MALVRRLDPVDSAITEEERELLLPAQRVGLPVAQTPGRVASYGLVAIFGLVVPFFVFVLAAGFLSEVVGVRAAIALALVPMAACSASGTIAGLKLAKRVTGAATARAHGAIGRSMRVDAAVSRATPTAFPTLPPHGMSQGEQK